MQPILVASQAKSGKPGPKAWVPGSKLWDSQIYHKSMECLKAYPAPFQVHDGGNDSMYQGLKSKESFTHIEAFASTISAKNSELLNGKRMYIGWSEAAGAMENFIQLVADGVHREVLHPNLGAKGTSMWDRFDLGAASRSTTARTRTSCAALRAFPRQWRTC